ncbi:hypothetical protein [Mucilaginibacter segetis]|uniref:MalT-like TPR region domain-containing protein n=1 Tax=Mucilaginibacter segetis TaxID=2793071 RepID=A0A934PVD8_9SPHI|nr:hypothetical protein [Mucilaginibacter segetis]MBK0380252.1 hypothetical protein [Mucilaginibacter segetis]
MRYIFIIILCALNLSASAQWWRLRFRKHERLPAITQIKDNSLQYDPVGKFIKADINPLKMPRSIYSIKISEHIAMNSAKHNMRYREFGSASYDFSELAKLYVLENRLSEAKWYYLQSIMLSKNTFDHQHTINSLINLAMVKADLGDLVQAQQDLSEARGIATSTGRTNDIKLIDEKIKYLKSNKSWLPKSELRYADAVGFADKTK